MPLEYFHDIDDEVIGLFKQRFHKWDDTLQTVEGAQRVRLTLKDGSDGNDEEFIDAFFRYGSIFNKKELVDSLLAEDGDVTAPVIIVSPQTPENLDQSRTYTEDDSVYKADTEEVLLFKGKRRFQFNYQVESITKKWHDHQAMRTLLENRVFSRTAGAFHVSLFGKNYSVEYRQLAENLREEREFFRGISTFGIKLDLYTLPTEVVESVEEIITSLENTDNIN